MRLIDADKALELFRAEYENTKNLIKQGETQLDRLAEGFTEAAHIIKDILPAVDAVPVVRCKDCAFCYKTGYSSGHRCGLYIDFHPVGEDHFCSYGERR